MDFGISTMTGFAQRLNVQPQTARTKRLARRKPSRAAWQLQRFGADTFCEPKPETKGGGTLPMALFLFR